MSDPAPKNPDAVETEPFPAEHNVAVAADPPSQIEATLDVAIEEMLAQLEPAEHSPVDAPNTSDQTANAADSPIEAFDAADSHATVRHSQPQLNDSSSEIATALTPINVTLQQQSEALIGLTQALQGLQLAVADLQFANRQTGPANTTPVTELPAAVDPPESPESPDDMAGEAEAPPEQCWDQIKAALLSGDEAPQVADPEPEPEAEPSVEGDLHYELVPHAEILQMEEEQLRKLLLEQERVISRLVQSARAQRKADMTFSPEDLRANADNMPEDLANQVRATLKTLDEQARLGELELSLERARISRQLSHLEDTRQVLESNARALGLEIGPEGRIVGDLKSVRNAGTKGRRWLGALGFGD